LVDHLEWLNELVDHLFIGDENLGILQEPVDWLAW
jgi:hypothetical protein